MGSPRARLSASARTEWWRPVPVAPAGTETLAAARTGEEQGTRGAFAFRAVLAFTFINLLSPQSFLPALQPLRLALVAALVGIGAHLAGSIFQGRPLTVRSPEMTLTAALVAWAVVTVPLSFWPGGSISFLLDLYFKTVAIFWLLANVVDTLARLRKVVWALTLMSIPLAVTGIKNFVTGGFLDGDASGLKRIVGYEGGLTANPNDLALTLNLILPLSAALLLSARTGRTRFLLGTVVLLDVAGVVVTFSRGGFVTLATIVGICLWRLARRGRAGLAAGVLAACLLAFAVLPSGYGSRVATITDINADATGSSQQRWADMTRAAGLALDHPLVGAGVGMNTLALYEARTAERVRAAALKVHSVYLELAVELGLPGLVLFVLLVRACLRTVRRVRRSAGAAGPDELARLAEGLEISLWAFAVAALFHPVAYQFYFYYMAGLSVAAGRVYRERSASNQARRRGPEVLRACVASPGR